VTIRSAHSDPARGGAEGYLAKLAERIRAHGHEVGENGDVVLATVPTPCDFYQPHHGLYAACIPPHYESMPWWLRHVRRLNPVRRLAFRRLREREAATIASARVLALSPRVIDDLKRFYPSARATLLRPGVDLARFFPVEGKVCKRVALFVARNRRLKGFRTAFRAARIAGAILRVAGDGDVTEQYAEANVLVHPTYYDTASLVVLEALACDVPPVTTRRDGNADLAVEGGGAALERPGDPQALARAIDQVIEYYEPGRARAVAERFDETVMLDQVVECICSS
jgi:glycosyltransferase involved in cell wall biosynthesis